MNVFTTPQTPSRADAFNQKIASTIYRLSFYWDLNLRMPRKTDSPKSVAAVLNDGERKCLHNVRWLTSRDLVDTVFERFEIEAQDLYNGWVIKPNARREKLVDPTSRRPRCVLPHERQELLECFNRISEEYSYSIKEAERSRGLRTPTLHKTAKSIDDSPVVWPLQTSERSIQPHYNSPSTNLRRTSPSRIYTPTRPLQPFEPLIKEPDKVSIQAGARETTPETKRVASDTNLDLPPKRAKVPTAQQVSTIKSSTSFNSVTTSFVSSKQSSIFDQAPNPEASFNKTQITAPDVSCGQIDKQSYRDRDASPSSSSNYGSSIDPKDGTLRGSDYTESLVADAVHLATTNESDSLSQNIDGIVLVSADQDEEASDPLESRLRKRLSEVFPENMPLSFLKIPFYFRYEILRVSLHTGVPLSALSIPHRMYEANHAAYDTLWDHLRSLPSMHGKKFPPKASSSIWALAKQGVPLINRSIILSGALTYAEDDNGPLFHFHLRPMILDHGHRLDRRFGCDRFMEIDVPNITGKRLPGDLQRLGSKGKEIVIEWLSYKHELFGRSWMAFCNKPLRLKQKRGKTNLTDTKFDNTAAHRMFYFAFDGSGFSSGQATPSVSETIDRRSSWSVRGLLNWLRPTQQNGDQPALKLYSRTTLGLSRNIPTVVVERSQIRYMRDIEYNSECMTDGAGRLSIKLAQKVAAHIGCDYMPSGFQARFGGAKGFWSIDPHDTCNEEWIEVYDSQRKWKRNEVGFPIDPDYDDPAHRTFEVNSTSSELKSAELNTQLLPILMDRAKNKSAMARILKQILIEGLTEAMDSQRVAMENPLTCRKWIRETNPNITDKVNLGSIAYSGALPSLWTERINLLLDAGFDPSRFQYLRELIRTLYEQKCTELKNDMKITVPKSTYAYMVPDFKRILAEGEIYFHMSNKLVPDDMLTSRLGKSLEGMELLVARSPAHFASDIQKVKAVFKYELFGLHDVIVFSTKGNPSLAAKLSGGDYDGDQAWVCWEPRIVSNFVNASVPELPDLVAEGYINKISTTYKDLTRSQADHTSVFLKHAFSFNLEQSMLGRCTIFKEDWQYLNTDLSSSPAIYLSKLLSDLVDGAKQGYIFTPDHFEKFRKTALKDAKRNKPSYKHGELNANSFHIMDRLTCAAHDITKKMLTKFERELPCAKYWDEDLVKMSEWAVEVAKTNPEWVPIIKKLKVDIDAVKSIWKKHFQRKRDDSSPTEEVGPGFRLIRDECFELFAAILPSGSSALTTLLLEPWHENSDLSKWALLRASFTFAGYNRNYVSNFVWWMAGKQLCHLKAEQTGIVNVSHNMYAMLRPDANFVKRRMLEIDVGSSMAGSTLAEDEGERTFKGDNDDDVVWMDD